MTFNGTLTVCVIPPPTAVMVMVDPATVAFDAATSFSVLLPLPLATLPEESVAVTPEGTPETESDTVEVNPPTECTPTLTLVLAPCARVTLLFALSVKLGTFNVKFTLLVTPPPVSFSVSEYLFGTVFAATCNVITLLPAPGAAMLPGA